MTNFGLVLLMWQTGGACVGAQCPFGTLQKQAAHKQSLWW